MFLRKKFFPKKVSHVLENVVFLCCERINAVLRKQQENTKQVICVTSCNVFVLSLGIRNTLYSGIQEKQQSGVKYTQQLHGLEGSSGA